MLEPQSASLTETFFLTAPDHRTSFVVNYLDEACDDVHKVWDLLDLYSAEPTVFSQGVHLALKRHPSNLTANRALAWILTREGQFEEAARTLLFLIENLPAATVERRELLRIGCVAPAALSSAMYEIGLAGLDTPLSQVSYAYMTGRVRGSSTLTADADRLREALRAQGNQIVKHIQLSAQGHPTPLGALLELLDSAKRIALVGNGPSLRGAGRGPEIDRYDLVIRCNFPVLANFANDVGSRTDVVLFTEALFRLFDMYLNRDPSYRSAHLMTIANPAAASGFDPERTAEAAGMQMARFPADVMEVIKDAIYRHPTTGAQAYLLLAALLGRQITVFGFDFYSQATLHYFSQTAGLWLAHEVQYEKFLFRGVVKPVFGAYYR